jgi:type III secretion protein Q
MEFDAGDENAYDENAYDEEAYGEETYDPEQEQGEGLQEDGAEDPRLDDADELQPDDAEGLLQDDGTEAGDGAAAEAEAEVTEAEGAPPSASPLAPEFTPEPADGHEEMDLVPVTLEFELGKARLPLGAVRALGVGAIVPFGAAAPVTIAILASGRRLGGGEVVEVEGQLAIRITQWGST